MEKKDKSTKKNGDKKKEGKIDPKKMIIYSEIMKPKFKE